jgi:hypothetical protein
LCGGLKTTKIKTKTLKTTTIKYTKYLSKTQTIAQGSIFPTFFSTIEMSHPPLLQSAKKIKKKK